MEMTITMSPTEQRRVRILTRILKGELGMAAGAIELALSERQLWRLRGAFERDGPGGLVHGNRGRRSTRRIDTGTRDRIIDLRQGTYGEINDSHFAELLAEREGIVISRESLRGILRASGIASPRRRRPPRYRSRRPRMAAEGLLLQLDGSRHDWLEGRGPWLTLIGAIDDATGKVVAAVFREQEDAAGYLTILRDTVETFGVPCAIYRDRHGAFAPTNPGAGRHDAPDGRVSLSQVGRALVELEVDSIVAGSPQAKGRIERLWGIFQDRLVTELRLAGVSELAAANAFLRTYLATMPASPSRRPTRHLPGGRSPTGSGSSGCSYSSTAARWPGTTRSGSTGGSSSCPAGRAPRTTPASSSRSTSGSTARSPPSMAGGRWRSWRPRPIRASSGPMMSTAPSAVSSPHRLRSPGRRPRITRGSESGPTASSTSND